MPKVSVIIPIYNAEKYLNECLDSVINQTLRDIEIICVNDGSTDGSSDILNEYAQKDFRIKIINKENGGYGKAMNIGLDNANGEYIGIVEPDDYVEADMFGALYSKAVEFDVDFVKSDYYTFNENKKQNYTKLSADEGYYSRVLYSENDNFFNLRMNTWTGIYKRAFIQNNNIRYNETPGARYQDQGFWFQTMIYANSVYILNKAFYHYRFYSINSTNNPNGFDWIRKEYDYIYSILSKNPELLEKYDDLYKKYRFENYRYNFDKLDKKDKEINMPVLRQIVRQICDNKDFNREIYNKKIIRVFNTILNHPSEYIDNFSLFEKIFSIKNTWNKSHKIITILGISIKIRR